MIGNRILLNMTKQSSFVKYKIRLIHILTNYYYLSYMAHTAKTRRILHLIRHAKPQTDPSIPSHEWILASDALEPLPELINQLNPKPESVVSSKEPKAIATAQALALALEIPHRNMLGLHEHLRYTTPFYEDPADFQAEMRRLFNHPSECVSGEESADAVRERFSNALNAVMAVNSQSCVAVVTHGTVRSLYVAHANGLDPAELWRRQKLLDVVSINWPDGKLCQED